MLLTNRREAGKVNVRIETLIVDNLREGIFCAEGKTHGEEMYSQLEAWLRGDMLRGRIARLENGEVAGFVIYYPIESAPLDISGEGLYVVQCVHVKAPYRNSGIGRALIESALSDARENGATGLAVEGFRPRRDGRFPYLPGSFFQHIGLMPGESRGSATIYYMSFDKNTSPPTYLQPRPPSVNEKYRVRVDLFDCRRCYLNIDGRSVVEAVTEKIGADRVKLVVHDQNNRQAILDKGMSSGMMVDGTLTYFQGPITEDDVMTAIEVAESAKRGPTEKAEER